MQDKEKYQMQDYLTQKDKILQKIEYWKTKATACGKDAEVLTEFPRIMIRELTQQLAELETSVQKDSTTEES